MPLFLAATLAPLLAVSAPVGASAGDTDDLHCLAYLSFAAGKVDGDMRKKVDAGALYYFGRIEARAPGTDINSEVAKILQAPGYFPGTYQADKARCHTQLDPLVGEFTQWRQMYEYGQ